MATVNVNSWAQFVEAVQVSWDTVVCPENAVWDMNELEPYGISYLTVNANIEGNGTSIMNLHASGALMQIGGAIEKLHFLNFVCDSASAIVSNSANINKCKFSGIWTGACFASRTSGTGGPHFSQCALNVETAATGILQITTGSMSLCNVRASASNATGIRLVGYNGGVVTQYYMWSRFWLAAPSATAIDLSGARANSIDGDLPLLATASDSPAQRQTIPWINIYNSDTAPQLAGYDKLVGVTSSQMRDADYLSGIGFPIGVEP